MGEMLTGMAGGAGAASGGGLFALLQSMVNPLGALGSAQTTLPSLGGADNAPNQSAMPAPPTDAAGMSQGFQGITQGFEGLNTMPRSNPNIDPGGFTINDVLYNPGAGDPSVAGGVDPFAALMAMFR